MMYTLKRAGLVLLPLYLMWSAANAAVPAVPEEEGVRGYLALGVGYLDLESNTINGSKLVGLGNDRINDITSSPDSRDTATPAVVGEVTWTLGNRNQLFLGSSVEDAVTLDGGAKAGWRKTFDKLGTMEAGVVTSGAVPLEVYEDPFVTGPGPRRKTTDRSYGGLAFDWDRIGSSGFGASLQARSIDIDKERSCGQAIADPTSPCNGVDASLLERDADEVLAKAYYTFKFGDKHMLRPVISYSDHDADGDAEDFDATGIKLSYGYVTQKSNLVVNVGWAGRDYDTANPLYGQERDSDILGIDATFFYNLDIWDGNWSAFVNGLYGEVDSDINFYDLTVSRISAGMAYRWK